MAKQMSKTCGFLGNSSLICKDDVAEQIRHTAIDLITNKQVNTFYVGVKGDFELLSHKVISQVRNDFPNIKIMLVIAYVKDLERCSYYYNDFYYPALSELGYKRWSISYRNEWIIDQSDFIIGYNRYEGRAYKYCKKAKNKGKCIIELGSKNDNHRLECL